MGGYPDARCDPHVIALDHIRSFERLNDKIGECSRHRRVGHIRKQHGKLVTTKPGDNVGLSDQFLEALCDFLQKCVANGMAQRIIDVFEMIQIDIEYCEGDAASPAGKTRIGQSLGECPTVGKTRERICHGELRNSLVRTDKTKCMPDGRPKIYRCCGGENEAGNEHNPSGDVRRNGLTRTRPCIEPPPCIGDIEKTRPMPNSAFGRLGR